MYLFVFNWVPSLQEAALPYSALPLGYIFSSFMVSMMIGSLLYTSIVSICCLFDPEVYESTTTGSNGPLTLHAKLSSLVCAVSALSFAVSIESKDEHIRFWAFCAFEACVGMYYPVQGMLRGTLISNEHRATVSFDIHVCVILYHTHRTVTPAVISVPRPAECFCGRLAPDWRVVRTIYGPYRKFIDARLLVNRDRVLPHRLFADTGPRGVASRLGLLLLNIRHEIFIDPVSRQVDIGFQHGSIRTHRRHSRYIFICIYVSVYHSLFCCRAFSLALVWRNQWSYRTPLHMRKLPE